ncbi:hypothetical protein KUCAC02_024290 [Chaenocephalus aceratus]|uniref:Uncharacterized protein n=1 Tax=Chaenocephalus aceratus TaxID=36190 RepID=A0ACB9WI82_CHAAC|nr:hypothetical protein KUCAC02_024290 [Chaenocephalus aceratus]
MWGCRRRRLRPPMSSQRFCLAEESRTQTNTDSDGGRKGGGAAKSPVKEVKWDAEGMTWEVYGASVDPEELGLAIQKHLELQIKETASHAAKLSRQNTSTSQQEGGGCQRKRSRTMAPSGPHLLHHSCGLPGGRGGGGETIVELTAALYYFVLCI